MPPHIRLLWPAYACCCNVHVEDMTQSNSEESETSFHIHSEASMNTFLFSDAEIIKGILNELVFVGLPIFQIPIVKNKS